MALSKIKTNSITDDAITAAKIADGTIVAADLAANSVDSSELVSGSVDTAHIAADNIVASLIADDAIDSEHYTDGSIDNAHIADDAINSEHYADGSIDNAHIADDQIDSEHYADASIDLAHMSSQSVDEDNLYISNSGSNGQFLSKQSGNNGGLTWADAGSNDPSSADGQALGSASLEWSDLFLADGGTIQFGNDQDITLTHVADGGLVLDTKSSHTDNLIIQTTDATANTAPDVVLYKFSASPADDDATGKFVFRARNDNTQDWTVAQITTATPDVSDGTEDGQLEFDVMTAGSSVEYCRMKAGTGTIFNEGGVDVDFRVETDTLTHAIYTDGGNNRVSFITAGDLGHVHIKTADSGGSVLAGADELVIEGSADSGMTILSGSSDTARICFGDSGGNDRGILDYSHGSDIFKFKGAAVERLQFAAAGTVIVNNPQTALGTHAFQVNGALNNTVGKFYHRNDSGNENMFVFYDGDGVNNGSISINTGANTVAYNTSSDYRLKENIDYDWDATTRLKQLKPARFNWISDGTNTLLEGFLAHEVGGIVPEAIFGEKDAELIILKRVKNANGNQIDTEIEEADWIQGKIDGTYPSDSTWTATETVIDPQSIDQAKLVPLLVKTVQELEARLTTLEG